MSKYTTEVRYICETAAGYNKSQDRPKVKDIIIASAPKIFDFDFPIFDEAYRLPLEIKILRHYYTREICAETVGLWKLWLEDKLNLIMPYYNKMYESELLEFNPFHDVDLTRDHTKDNEGEGENQQADQIANARHDVVDSDSTSATTGTSASNGWELYSDTPQGGLNGLIDDDDPLTQNNYLTNATRNINSVNTTENNTSSVDTTTDTTENTSKNMNATNNYTSTEEYLEHIRGKQGSASYSKLLMEFRETFLNIDLMIIKELEDLFFNLW